jgi:hypothetical protein
VLVVLSQMLRRCGLLLESLRTPWRWRAGAVVRALRARELRGRPASSSRDGIVECLKAVNPGRRRMDVRSDVALPHVSPQYCSKRCAYYPGPLDLSKLSAQLTQVKRLLQYSEHTGCHVRSSFTAQRPLVSSSSCSSPLIHRAVYSLRDGFPPQLSIGARPPSASSLLRGRPLL